MFLPEFRQCFRNSSCSSFKNFPRNTSASVPAEIRLSIIKAIPTKTCSKFSFPDFLLIVPLETSYDLGVAEEVPCLIYLDVPSGIPLAVHLKFLPNCVLSETFLKYPMKCVLIIPSKIYSEGLSAISSEARLEIASTSFFFRNVSSVILGKFPKHYTNLPRTFLKAVHFFKLIHNFSELQ